VTTKVSKDLTPLQAGAIVIFLLAATVWLFVATAPYREQEAMMREQADDSRACTALYNENPLTEEDRADVDAALALHGC